MDSGPEEILPLVELDRFYNPADYQDEGVREGLVDEQMIAEVSGPVVEVYRRLIGELPKRITIRIKSSMSRWQKMQVKFFGERRDPHIWLEWVIHQPRTPDVMGPGRLGWYNTKEGRQYGTGQGLGKALIQMKEDIGRRVGYSKIAFDPYNRAFWAKVFATDAGMEYEQVYRMMGEEKEASFGPWAYEEFSGGVSFLARDIGQE